ncbi:hypothetical protein EV121DRAFT_264630 [Schizophyllum commune]
MPRTGRDTILLNAMGDVQPDYPSLSPEGRARHCRRLLHIMEYDKPFADLALDPDLLVANGLIRLPVNLVETIPCRNAYNAILTYNLLIHLVHYEANTLDNPDSPICQAAFREWPNVMRWAAFFHPKFKNVAPLYEEQALKTIRRFFCTTCDIIQGDRIVLETGDSLNLVLDLWLNFYDYAARLPLTTTTKKMIEEGEFEKNEYKLLVAVWRFFHDLPCPGTTWWSHPDAARVSDGFIAICGGKPRQLYRKALSTRISHYLLTQDPIPCDELMETISTVEEVIGLVNRRTPSVSIPRSVIHSVIQAWKDTASLPNGDDVGMACAHLFTTIHSRCTSDARYLEWGVGAGLLPLVLNLIRTRPETKTEHFGVPPVLLGYLRYQMVHRNFVRLMRCHGGSDMEIREDDYSYVATFINAYRDAVSELDKDYKTLAEEHLMKCRFDSCPDVCGDIPLKRCECRVVHYCSRRCQAADWKRHRQYCRVLNKSILPGFSVPSYRYAIIMSRKIINQERDLILRKIKAWYDKPDSDVVRRQLVVFLDFAERNQALLTGTTISEITDCGPTIKLATWPARSEDIEKGGPTRVAVTAYLAIGGRGRSPALRCGEFELMELITGEISLSIDSLANFQVNV